MNLIHFIVIKLTCTWNLLKKKKEILISLHYMFAFLFEEKQQKYFKN